MTTTDPAPALLDVVDLAVSYRTRRETVSAVRRVDLAVRPRETVAIVGESGSGKSTTAHAVLGLLPPSAGISGSVRFDGQELVGLPPRRWRAVRGREIALIPQDPKTSLNPVMTVGAQVAEALTVHGTADRRAARERAVELLAEVGLPEPAVRARQYPSQLSGGMCQRALIAMAIAGRPRLIVADEPTSALDVTVQRRILDNIEQLTRTSGTSVLLITHDLGVAAERADRLVVMRGGRIVEVGSPDRLLSDPQEDYTRALIAAAPGLTPAVRAVRTPVDGRVAERSPAGSGIPGDPFAPPAGEVSAPGTVHVELRNLGREFRLPRSGGRAGVLRAVDDLSLVLRRGRTFGLVGESGSGKSTAARLLLRLTEPSAGRILLDGADITGCTGSARRDLRRRMQIVYQNPYASLNPRMTIEQVVRDPLDAFGLGTRAQRRARAARLVSLVELPASTLQRRPAELSGGQRQRVAIARALALNPELLVCDEAVSALDVSVQAQILGLLADLQAELGLTYLFITHDLAVVRRIADEVGVMRAGRLVEAAPTEQIFTSPAHEYTRDLLASIPGRNRRTAPAAPSSTAPAPA